MRALTTFSLAIIFIALGFGYAAITHAAYGKTDWSPEQQQILQVLDDWEKAYQNGDYEKMREILTEDAIISSASLKGNYKRDDYIELVKKKQITQKSMMDSQETTRLNIKITISGDTAEVEEKYEVTTRTPGGNRGLTNRSTYGSEIKLKKENGTWKIYYRKSYKLF